jgi:hypothetical protein
MSFQHLILNCSFPKQVHSSQTFKLYSHDIKRVLEKKVSGRHFCEIAHRSEGQDSGVL